MFLQNQNLININDKKLIFQKFMDVSLQKINVTFHPSQRVTNIRF